MIYSQLSICRRGCLYGTNCGGDGESGTIAALAHAAVIMVYDKTDTGWQCVETHPYNNTTDASALRGALERLMETLGDCRILVGKQIAGIAYHALSRQRFHLFEAPDFQPELLDGILEDIRRGRREESESPAPSKEPYSPEGDGNYVFDLIALQRAYPEISSKKALRRFLEEEPFLSLKLTCSHLPPWTQDVFLRRSLSCSVTVRDGIVEAVILPRKCGG